MCMGLFNMIHVTGVLEGCVWGYFNQYTGVCVGVVGVYYIQVCMWVWSFFKLRQAYMDRVKVSYFGLISFTNSMMYMLYFLLCLYVCVTENNKTPV